MKIFVFADISGFTKTTEKFIQKSKYGAEKISDMINNVFSGVINGIYEKKGLVLHFAGDAILFYVNNNKDLTDCRIALKNHINRYNKQNNTELGIKFDICGDNYFPQILKCKKRDFLFFSTHKNNIDYDNVKTKLNPYYPARIKDIKDQGGTGELRTVPLGFFHINEKVSLKRIKKLLRFIINTADNEHVFINKIEYADKGWMILISAGLPESLEKANEKLYFYIKNVIKQFKKHRIPIKAGITLQKGFAGIIGNDTRWEYTFMGNNVNLAARITIKAQNYSIECDKNFALSLSMDYETKLLKREKFKGMKEPVDIFTINEKRKKSGNIFVGRHKEILIAKNSLQNEFSVIEIDGEGGIGKTYFINEVLSHSLVKNIFTKGIRKQIPYSSMNYLIDSIYNNHEIINNAEILNKLASMSIREKFITLFKNIKIKVNIIIDDAHLLDNESKELFKWAFYEGNGNINFIIIKRPIGQIDFLSSKLSKYKLTEIVLKGFNKDYTSSLITEFTGLKPGIKNVDNFQKMSNGNPLFIVQLLSFLEKEKLISSKKGILKIKTNINELPYSLQELILLKFDSLKNTEKQFLETGAVIGDEFDSAISIKTNKIDEKIRDIIESPISNRLLNRKKENIVAFYHSIIRQIIYDKMLEKDIRRISSQIADELSISDNPYHILQAGDFYKIANDKRAIEMFLKSAKLFEKKKDYEYSKYALKKVIIAKPNKFQMEEAFSILNKIGEYSADYEIIIIFLKHLKYLKLGTENPKNYLLLAEFLLGLGRDTKNALLMLKMYEKMRGYDNNYLMLKAAILTQEERIDEANIIYRKMINDNTMSREENIGLLIRYGFFSFINMSSAKQTEYVIDRLKKLERFIKNEKMLMEYYSFLSMIAAYTNDMKNAEIYSKLQYKIAKKYNNKKILIELYNTYSIIYTAKAVKENNPNFLKKALYYNKKIYNEFKKTMQMNNLPLITTNYGSSLMSIGNIKMGIKYYYEGLLYGLEVNHYIEIPYNWALIAKFAFLRGANNLAAKLSKRIIKEYPFIDMNSTANTILYCLDNNENNRKSALKVSKDCLTTGHTLPYTDYFFVLFNCLYKIRDIKKLLKWKQEIDKFLNKNTLRPRQLLELKANKNIVDIMNHHGNMKQAFKYIENSKKTGFISITSAYYYYELALLEKNRKKKIELLKNAMKIARKLCVHIFIDLIEKEFISINYNKGYYKKQNKRTQKIINDLKNVKTIENFIEIIQKS